MVTGIRHTMGELDVTLFLCMMSKIKLILKSMEKKNVYRQTPQICHFFMGFPLSVLPS